MVGQEDTNQLAGGALGGRSGITGASMAGAQRHIWLPNCWGAYGERGPGRELQEAPQMGRARGVLSDVSGRRNLGVYGGEAGGCGGGRGKE